jgi:predicted nucleic-acid-binding protein
VIALDTNVLVRYLVEDDVRQSAQAARFIERAGQPLFVPQFVICELVSVLSFAYEVPRREIISLLQQIRRAANLVIESADEVQRAIDAFAAQRGDFADYLIAERAITSGCTAVATFDRALLTDKRFVGPA